MYSDWAVVFSRFSWKASIFYKLKTRHSTLNLSEYIYYIKQNPYFRFDFLSHMLHTTHKIWYNLHMDQLNKAWRLKEGWNINLFEEDKSVYFMLSQSSVSNNKYVYIFNYIIDAVICSSLFYITVDFDIFLLFLYKLNKHLCS